MRVHVMGVLLLALLGAGCTSQTETEPTPAESSPLAPSEPVATPSTSPTPRLLVEPDLRRAGRLFLDFAAGRKATPPSDTPVGLLLGGRRLATLEGPELGVRRSWRLCPPEGSYAARICPFSSVEALAAYDGRVRMTTEAPAHPCMVRRDRPYRGRWLTLEPAEDSDCVGWFAVVLAVNDVAQVTAVDLVLPEP